jgi:hypothetical protein
MPQSLWNVIVALLLTGIELIVSAFLLAPGPVWRWCQRQARALSSRIRSRAPRRRWQEVRS